MAVGEEIAAGEKTGKNCIKNGLKCLRASRILVRRGKIGNWNVLGWSKCKLYTPVWEIWLFIHYNIIVHKKANSFYFYWQRAPPTCRFAYHKITIRRQNRYSRHTQRNKTELRFFVCWKLVLLLYVQEVMIILYSKLLYRMGQIFMDILYVQEVVNHFI